MNSTLKTRQIRLLPTSIAPAATQMAAGPALLAGVGETGIPAMRWYQVAPSALILGSSQQPHEVNLAAAGRNVSLHRRSSGGGVVRSDDLLSLDLALPLSDPLFLQDVTASYRWLGDVWVEALQSLGIAARLVGIDEARADRLTLDPLLKRVCFAGLSPYEVAVGPRKLVGLAQVRRQQGALFQAGIYLDWVAAQTSELVAATADEQASLNEQLQARVTGLHNLGLRQTPGITAIVEAVATALQRQTGLIPATASWSAAELRARQAALARYAALSDIG